ncbi:MAG TPA: GNAT family N-acetyltransferase [Spirochaetia bacterium]|nr:GNAT family N-acetyltransferase [Spirochaetia bacterium]
METIKIREAQISDAESISLLLKDLNEAVRSPGDMDVQSVRDVLKSMNDCKEIYRNYVGVLGGRIVGFISLIFYKSFLHTGGTALVNELVVSKRHRDKGIGRVLMERAVRSAQEAGMDEIEVGTEMENKKAQRFYRKNGFSEEYILLGQGLGKNHEPS